MVKYKFKKHNNFQSFQVPYPDSPGAKVPNQGCLFKTALELYNLAFKICMSNKQVLSEDPIEKIKPYQGNGLCQMIILDHILTLCKWSKITSLLCVLSQAWILEKVTFKCHEGDPRTLFRPFEHTVMNTSYAP